MSAITPDLAQSVLQQADLIHSQHAIESALDRMALAITERLQDKNPLVVCVMMGGLMPTAFLISRLKFPFQLDYIHATRYRGKTSGGELHWIARAQQNLRDRMVLLVDDILDEGHTLKSIVDDCLAHGAKDVLTAVALSKDHGRGQAMQATFVGLTVPDRYVFGFGMDYKEYWRALPAVYAIKE